MSRRAHRVHETPGYLLHATAWKETSLIVQAFTREHGTVALVAKGAKRPQSALRPVLSIFQPVLLTWTGSQEIKTLARVECAGILPLTGKAWMSAWYLNELLLRLLPREDAHENLFAAYDEALRQLAQGSAAAGALRRFEWMLLKETGYGLDGVPPDFDDPAQAAAMRAPLRERIDYLLAGRPLNTRKVLMALQGV
jgi:DNA repair protein RecO (recombination protein O)